MQWLFPLAGRGTRTRKLGKFKPFIKILDRAMLQWCLTGLTNLVQEDDRFIFITTEAFESEFNVRQNIATLLADLQIHNPFQVLLARETPAGPAASVYLSKDLLVADEACTVVNADQFIAYDQRKDLKHNDGYLPTYFNTTGKSSYVEIHQGRITAVHEKVMKTHYASAGVYCLGSARLLIESIEYAFANKLLHKDEYYIGPALNYVISQGGTLYPVSTHAKWDLGSLDGITRFTRMMHLLGQTPETITP